MFYLKLIKTGIYCVQHIEEGSYNRRVSGIEFLASNPYSFFYQLCNCYGLNLFPQNPCMEALTTNLTELYGINTFEEVIKIRGGPDWVTWLVGASSHTPKVCRFHSWSGHIPYFAMYNVQIFAQIFKGKIRMHIIHGQY